MITKQALAEALDDTLQSFDNIRTWSKADIFLETAEAGGYMGSDSAYRFIDRDEFVDRLYARLFPS
jgi:hypothetical protein